MAGLGIFYNAWWLVPLLSIGALIVIALASKITPLNWKILETSALLLGAIGLISSVLELQTDGYATEARILGGYSEQELLSAKDVTEVLQLSCVPSTKGSFVPDNFDEIEKEKKVVCAWGNTLQDRLSSIDHEAPTKLSDEFIASAPRVSLSVLPDRIVAAEEQISRWNNHVERWEKAVRNSSKGPPRWLLAISPYLLALSLGIGLASIWCKPNP